MMGAGRLGCWSAAQVGWDAAGRFPEGFIPQVRQALRTHPRRAGEAGAGPPHEGSRAFTWYASLFDMDEGAYAPA